MDGTLLPQAEELLARLDRDPQGAGRAARELVARSRRAGELAASSVAGRAAGVAAMQTGELTEAGSLLEGARLDGTRAGRPDLAAKAQMSLAFVLARRGDATGSLSLVEQALAALTGHDRSQALAQRGGIHHQFDVLDRALEDYAAALPVLRLHEDWVWVQRVLCNRGLLHVYRGDLHAAELDLVSAVAICREHGLDLQLAFALENLAFLHARAGDVPQALRRLEEAEDAHVALGADASTVLLDRAELLLAVGVAEEARHVAERAVAGLARSRWSGSRAQAQLLLAEACLRSGDLPAAQRAAAGAAAAFRRQQRPEWEAVAQQLQLRCRLAAGGRVSAYVLGGIADRLDGAGWRVPALDTRLLAARVALEKGDAKHARALLRAPGGVRRTGPVDLRARAWHVEALLRLADGRPAAALAALRAGVALVEEHQATMGAADLRSSVSSHRAELVDLGLALCLDAGRAREVLRWAERGRATALLTRPLRPPADDVLAARLVELRAAVAELEEAREAGTDLAALQRRQAALEREVRDRARLVPGSAVAVQHPSVSDLASALGERALVEYVESRGELHAVTVVGGRARLTALGPVQPVLDLLAHVPLALQRLTRRSASERANDAARALLADVGARLDALLVAPLAGQVGDRPLVVVPSAALHCLPWALLPSCLGRPLTVSPSAALWFRAALRPPRTGGVTVVAGPGLPGAEDEARQVAALHPGARLLTGAEASVASVSEALLSSGTLHVAAHGTFRGDNALFSHLRLADGPLTVYDLEALHSAPGLVVLAACDAARAWVCLGDEVLGLAAAFLGMGTGTLIAALVPVVDSAVAPLMVALHQLLRAGVSPANALATVQRDALARGDAAEIAAALGLVCLGADVAALPAQRVSPEAGAPALQRIS
ncbi:CHAT domain-containing protein [Motilibacter rhizosphaerae]|uniref:CHAT domain-containing protein n=1 Tax=Motilibacter rhizosphaerae TaxID=598652 RepID=A0A4Q7NUY8_9ACTN|nr:CHAT domain-containing tetratricopeptide repeat protein [Motilibacter rhizosphaerae]RZS91046.1 CHAT domain-containing protein [Motilibacter rhizosphaerae]